MVKNFPCIHNMMLKTANKQIPLVNGKRFSVLSEVIRNQWKKIIILVMNKKKFFLTLHLMHQVLYMDAFIS